MPSLSLELVARKVRESGEDAAMAARLARDLPRFLRRPIGPDEARERLWRRLAAREQRLRALVERSIYGYRRSTYLRLLHHAGCELGDCRALIAREGVEGGLAALAELGRGGPANQYNLRLWRSVGTLEICRERVLATRAGKVLPFQLLRRSGGAGGPRGELDARPTAPESRR